MQNIGLPKTIEVVESGANRAVIAIGPCYPGYGTTLGNAMRRILLSSLPGAAITDVSIEGVQHEFGAIQNVKEDVVSILLNLKRIRLTIDGEETLKINLNAKGEREVTAKDFKTPSQVRIINGSQPIATLTDKTAQLNIEATVSSGRGYLPVENREKEKREIGKIAIDAVFTPIKTVNYTIEHVRVEQMTNYDRVRLEIVTDGTISPEDAFTRSAKILSDHFMALAGAPLFTEATSNDKPSAKKKENKEGPEITEKK